jgi:tetratricopeptide (TPR) repeat protein/4-amino-4-deoxy-L-arabinose transferase-like glycosyltransferase
MGKRRNGAGKRAPLVAALGVFLLAALVRGIYLYDSSDNPTFRVPIVDAMTYDQMARGVVEGRGITEEFFWQPVFYPLFLSAVYRLSDCSILWAKVIQMALGSITCVLVYRLGTKLFGRSAGILAGVITAVYMPLVFFEGELLATGWAAFWSAAVVLLLIGAKDKPTVCRCFALGLGGALSIIVRPVFLPFFAAGCVWLAVRWIREKTAAKALAAASASLTAGFLLVTAPVAALSCKVMGRASILPHSGGVNLYIGNNPNYQQTVAIRPGRQWTKLVELPLRQGITDRYQQQRFFTRKTVEYIRNEPGRFLSGLAHKTVQFVGSREMPRNVDIYLFRKWSRLLLVGVWKVGRFGFPFGLLLPLAVVGLIYTVRKVAAPVWLFILLYPASVILVFVTARYRTPMVPVMAVLAGAGCAAIGDFLRGGRWAKLTAAAAVIVAVGMGSSLPGPFPAERQTDYEAELYYCLGGALEKLGRIEESIEAYYKAVDLRRDYAEAYHNMALLLTKQKRIEHAVANFNIALKLDPENSDVHKDLGRALFQQGKTDDAVGHYYKAIELEPDNAKAHSYLALALAAQGKLDQAIRYYRAALQLEPNDGDVHYSLAVALQMQGSVDEAIKEYNDALRIYPDLVNAHSNLGVIFAAQGKLDEAVAHFDKALRIKPAAGIYCNLGIALQSQGKIDKAAEAFRKALAIDPNHKQARRALEKLQTSNP